ncbi:MAG: phosphopantetheine-binding protein [Chloroflexaceae bacterium]
MTRAELRRIVADVLEVDPELLQSDTELTQIESFTSVAVLTLMIELDMQAGVKIFPEEASKLRLYGDIEAVVERHGVTLSA